MPKLKINYKKPIIMSIGGSLIVPNGGPDATYLRSLKKMIDGQLKRGRRFVIVTGGGKTARHYVQAASDVINKIDPEDLDWLGIHATRLNGHLMRTIFRKVAHPVMIKDPTRTPTRFKEQILVAAGWKPGWSTDYVACRIAKRLGSETILNVSNIDYVYDRDPREHKDAKPVEEMSWVDFRKIVGNEWSPVKSAPFDPVASRFCHKYKMRVAIVNGEDMTNVGRLVDGSKFKGTILQ
ncbi:MAG: UMP kinase [bacterium]